MLTTPSDYQNWLDAQSKKARKLKRLIDSPQAVARRALWAEHFEHPLYVGIPYLECPQRLDLDRDDEIEVDTKP